MSWLRSIVGRLSALFRKGRLDADLDDELRFHLSMEEQENVRNGMSAEEARRQARLRLGGMEQVKEEYRDRRGIPFLESLLQDLRFAFRSFRRDPGFTATALVTMALGIGVVTAIFAVVNAILLEPLPYKDPERLVTLWRVNTREGGNVEPLSQRTPLSPADFYDWRDESGLFESAAAVVYSATSFDNHKPIYDGQYVDEGFCPTLGAQPLLGRCFASDDFRSDATRTYILQYDFWKSDFGGDRGVVGRRYEEISGREGTIIGVMPPDFVLVDRSTKWLHGRSFVRRKAYRSIFNVRPIARLKAGLTLEEAQAGADVFSRRLAAAHPDVHAGWRVVLVPVSEEAAGHLRSQLLLLLLASGLVLLVVCFNIAGIVLVRSMTRSTEFAVRSAIGAGRGRLIRQLVTENTLLSLIGGLMGLGSAWLLVDYLRSWIPGTATANNVLRVENIQIDPRVITFATAVALASGALVGMIPALRGTSVRLAHWIKEGSGGTLSGMQARQTRHWLGVAQVSLAVVLTIGACLLVRSFQKLHQMGPGFQAEGIVALPINASHRIRSEALAGRGQELRRLNYFEKYWNGIYEGLRTIPGVSLVTSTSLLPMKGRSNQGYWPNGDDKALIGLIFASGAWTDTGYFRTLGIPLIEGRLFDSRDRPDSTAVAIINEEAARRFWPGESPIGKKLHEDNQGEPTEPGMTVVGVVGDVRMNGLQLPPRPIVYRPARHLRGAGGWVLVSSPRNADSLLTDIAAKLREIDPDLRPYAQQYHRLDHLVRDSVWQLNYSMLLLTGLASVALIVSAIGVYSVLSYTAVQRTREIGLRLALGADGAQVLWMVLRQGLSIGIIGVSLGLVVAVGVTRFLESLLYGVEPLDGLTFAFVAVVMMVAAFLASYLPARSATRVDPMAALRHE